MKTVWVAVIHTDDGETNVLAATTQAAAYKAASSYCTDDETGESFEPLRLEVYQLSIHSE